MKPKPDSRKNAPPEQAIAHEADRGRTADKPSDLPPKGWFDVLWRTKQQLEEDNLSIVAAGVAFYGFVATVPALAATIALYALISNPADVSHHVESLAKVVPGEAMPLLRDQMTRIALNSEAASFSAIIGLLLALYSSAKATKAMLTGLNIAYDEAEHRNFLKLNALAVVLTLATIIGLVAVISLVAGLPALLNFVGLSAGTELLLSWLRWPILIGFFMTGLAALYHFGPSRNAPQWRWVSWGAMVAAVVWVLGSAAFSLYVSKFGNYDKTYGSLGAVVVFLLWLYLSVYAVLLGAELNAEMERQTAKDTTEGPPAPLGERGAYAADTVGIARAPKTDDAASRRRP